MRGFPFATDKRSFASLDFKAITRASKKICGVCWPMGKNQLEIQFYLIC